MLVIQLIPERCQQGVSLLKQNALYKIETRRAAQEALRNLDELPKHARDAQRRRFERQLEMLERRPQNRR